jgi:hypothetical protein
VSQLKNFLNEGIINPVQETEENLCADAGYTGEPAKQIKIEHGFIPHFRSRGEEKVNMKQGYNPRRLVVEDTLSWFNRFRKVLVLCKV